MGLTGNSQGLCSLYVPAERRTTGEPLPGRRGSDRSERAGAHPLHAHGPLRGLPLAGRGTSSRVPSNSPAGLLPTPPPSSSGACAAGAGRAPASSQRRRDLPPPSVGSGAPRARSAARLRLVGRPVTAMTSWGARPVPGARQQWARAGHAHHRPGGTVAPQTSRSCSRQRCRDAERQADAAPTGGAGRLRSAERPDAWRRMQHWGEPVVATCGDHDLKSCQCNQSNTRSGP